MKKLFPGVTNQDIYKQDQENSDRARFFNTQEELERSMFDIEEREIQDQEAAIAEEQQKQAKQRKIDRENRIKQKRREDAHLLYGNGDVKKLPKRGNNWKFWILTNLQFNLFLFCVYWIAMGEFYDSRFWGVVNEMYNPTPNVRTEKPLISDVAHDKPFFVMNAALVCAWMIFTACVVRGRRKNDKKIRKQVSARHETIDFMLDLKEHLNSNGVYYLQDKTVENLINMCPEIVSHMSANDRVYFDRMLNGDISMANDETFKKWAVSVMQGHLKSHPEDLQEIMSAFDEKSIVEILSYMYHQGIVR